MRRPALSSAEPARRKQRAALPPVLQALATLVAQRRAQHRVRVRPRHRVLPPPHAEPRPVPRLMPPLPLRLPLRLPLLLLLLLLLLRLLLLLLLPLLNAIATGRRRPAAARRMSTRFARERDEVVEQPPSQRPLHGSVRGHAWLG